MHHYYAGVRAIARGRHGQAEPSIGITGARCARTNMIRTFHLYLYQGSRFSKHMCLARRGRDQHGQGAQAVRLHFCRAQGNFTK